MDLVKILNKQFQRKKNYQNNNNLKTILLLVIKIYQI